MSAVQRQQGKRRRVDAAGAACAAPCAGPCSAGMDVSPNGASSSSTPWRGLGDGAEKRAPRTLFAPTPQPPPPTPAPPVGPLKAPAEFPFPFEPYGIQRRFMAELYDAIEAGGLGIFESPTGTGKSVSLLCGALKWLHDNERRSDGLGGLTLDPDPAADGQEESEGLLDWVTEQTHQIEQDEQADRRQALRERIEAQTARIARAKSARSLDGGGGRKPRPFHRHRKGISPSKLGKTDGGAAGDGGGSREEVDDEDLILSDMDEPADLGSDSEAEAEENPDVDIVKILYCSRTHSQLSQLVQEAKQTPYGPDLRVVSLGSRQTLCVNDAVRKLGSLSLINERCLDLQKHKEEDVAKGAKPKKGCPYKQPASLDRFRDLTLSEVHDIEEAVRLGHSVRACPYYASRRAIAAAQLVAMPYNTLLHKDTREAVGVSVKGNIVIIDEAHNLLESISNIHSVFVSEATISRALAELRAYHAKYMSRLKGTNLKYVNMIIGVVERFAKHIQGLGRRGAAGEQGAGSALQKVGAFLHQLNIDNINLFELFKFCERSELSKKLNGFVQKYEPSVAAASAEGDAFVSKHVSGLRSVESLFQALTNADKNGRVVVTYGGKSAQNGIKFLLLNPSVYFQDILADARAVIVAGGTMSPVSSFVAQLLCEAPAMPKVHLFSCGHIVPRENLNACVVKQGPNGIPLNFSFSRRNRASVQELGRLVSNICTVVPGGVVVFFPSYDYERVVFEQWRDEKLTNRIEKQKRIFREARRGGAADTVLADYTQCIREGPGSGAILLSVVGGKMSEGINFKDDLGRCIVMVGLPYPNRSAPELQEKLRYLQTNAPPQVQLAAAKGLPGPTDTAPQRGPADEYYENLCMKAVNQSIGRAIRHKGDFASIVLVDERYDTQRHMQRKLAPWILKGLRVHETYGEAHRGIAGFFKGHGASPRKPRAEPRRA